LRPLLDHREGTPLPADPQVSSIAAAQEHTDLKLGEVSAQFDYLREQNESLQKILKEVE
jgi:hypothetical protein